MRKSEESEYMEDRGVDGIVILTGIFKKKDGGLDQSGSG